MAIVQKSSNTVNGASTISPALTGVTAGNTLVLLLSANSMTDVTPTDSSGQTWSKAFYLTNAACEVACYYLLSANAGTHTLSRTAGGSTFIDYSLVEVPTCTAVDLVSTVGTALNTATTISTPSITTTNANDSIFAIMAADTNTGSTNANITDPVSGWTSVYAQQNTSADVGCQFSYKEVASTGAQSATWTFNADASGSLYAAASVAFKRAAAAWASAGKTASIGSGALTTKTNFTSSGTTPTSSNATLSTVPSGAVLTSSTATSSTGTASLTTKSQLTSAGITKSFGSGALVVASTSGTLDQYWLKSWQDYPHPAAQLQTGSNPLINNAGDALFEITAGWDNTRQIPVATDDHGTFTILTDGTTSAVVHQNFITVKIAGQANASSGSHSITPALIQAGSNGGDGEIGTWILSVPNLGTSFTVRDVKVYHNVSTSSSWGGDTGSGVQAGDFMIALGTYENSNATVSGGLSTQSGWNGIGINNDATNFIPTISQWKVATTSGAQTVSFTTTDPNKSEDFTVLVTLVPTSAPTGVALSSVGTTTSQGSGSLINAASLSSAGITTASNVAGLTTHVAFTGAGLTSSAGAGALSTQVALVGAGITGSSSLGSLTTRVALVSLGLTPSAGVGALAAQVTLAAAGVTTSAGSGTLTVRAVLASAGATSNASSAALSLQAMLVSSGITGLVASGTLSLSGPLLSAGKTGMSGSGALTTRVALSSLGVTATSNAGALSSGVLLSSHGVTPTSGVGAIGSAIALSSAGLTASSSSAALTTKVALSSLGVTQASSQAAFTLQLAFQSVGVTVSSGSGSLDTHVALSSTSSVPTTGSGSLITACALSSLGVTGSGGLGALVSQVVLSSTSSTSTSGTGTLLHDTPLQSFGLTLSVGSGNLTPLYVLNLDRVFHMDSINRIAHVSHLIRVARVDAKNRISHVDELPRAAGVNEP